MKKRLFLHFRLLPVVFFFSAFTFTANHLLAQASESQVKISISIKETGYHNIDDKGKNKLVWKFYKGSSNNEESVLRNDKLETCFQVKSKKNNKTKEISDEKDDLRPFEANISGFYITMEAFNNKKGGEKCISDPKDMPYSKTPMHIKLDNLSPGVWSEEVKIEDAYPYFFAIIVYKYDLIDGLEAIQFSGNNLINDASKNIELSLAIKLPKKETLPFTWSYSIGNEDNWNTIPNSGEDKSKIDFNPLKTIFANKTITGSQKVNFKAEGEIGGKTESSQVLTLAFAPPPPFFNKEKDMVLTPVCNGAATGSIEIKNIKATASGIKYVLRKKRETAEPCNFKDPSSETCPDFITDGTVSGKSNFKIRNLAAGDYVIYIFNSDLESGEVNTSTTFTLTELAPLKIIDQDQSTKHPTCTNPRGGEIHMNVEGGAKLWQIAIIPNVVPDKGKIVWEGNTISFKNLEAGKYTVYLTDQCGGDGHEIRKTFTLKKPKQISIDTKNISPFQDKTDFYIQLPIQNGSNDYKVKVTDEENNISETAFSFLPDMKIPVSKLGSYTIEITDVATPLCPAAKVKVKVEKSPNSKKEKFKIKVLDE